MPKKGKKTIGRAAAEVAESLLKASAGSPGAMKGAGGKSAILRQALSGSLPGRKPGISYEKLVTRILGKCEAQVSQVDVQTWLQDHQIR